MLRPIYITWALIKNHPILSFACEYTVSLAHFPECRVRRYCHLITFAIFAKFGNNHQYCENYSFYWTGTNHRRFSYAMDCIGFWTHEWIICASILLSHWKLSLGTEACWPLVVVGVLKGLHPSIQQSLQQLTQNLRELYILLSAHPIPPGPPFTDMV